MNTPGQVGSTREAVSGDAFAQRLFHSRQVDLEDHKNYAR